MSRSTALRASIAALAVLPAFSACSMLPGSTSQGNAEATPAAQETTQESQDNDQQNNNGSDDQSRDSDSNSNEDSDSNNDSDSNSNNDSDSNSSKDSDSNADSGNNSNNNSDSNDNSMDDNDQDASNTSSNSTGGDSSSSTSNSNDSGSNGSDSSSSGSNSGSGSGSASSEGQKIDVPSGSGISDLRLVKLQGGTAAGGQNGLVVGVFKATTDRPMMLNLRVKLYDANGKMIASKAGLNSMYTTGDHDLVTTNYITLPAGAKPKTFKVSLEGKTDMKNGFTITEMGRPTVGKYKQNRGVQSLKGTALSTTPVKGSVTIKAACIGSDGKVYQGTDSLSNNARQNGRIAYEIPIYDAKNVDLSNAKCYVSA